MNLEDYDVAVIGGGFFGCSLATHLSKKGQTVVLIEQEEALLSRASYTNQARVHNGYHYPRSLLTALRSRVNYPQFRKDFEKCIYDKFSHYYAVPRNFSKVTASQFRRFMERIGSPIKSAPDRIKKLFSKELTEEVFLVEECAFNADTLCELISDELMKEKVAVYTNTEVINIHRDGEKIDVVCQNDKDNKTFKVKLILNCTYSCINTILSRAALPLLKLKHEIAEMALVEVPEELYQVGVTVMCGPFFSLMPFPARGLHTLSHVRYTPHCSWQEEEGMDTVTNPYDQLKAYSKKSKFEHMKRDAARYLPLIEKTIQHDSLWEVKTVLPQSEADDSRPILFQQADREPALWSIMGGKIDNIYDAIAQWDQQGRVQ